MSGTPEVRPVDSVLECRRLAYVLSEALERRARLQQILARQEVFIVGERLGGEPANALQKLRGRLQEHTKTFLGNSDLLAAALRGSPLNKAQLESITAALAILITGIRQVHELLVLLPREGAKPQASFLLQDCLGRIDLKVSIVLTNSLSAYEYRFEDVLEVNIHQDERGPLTQGGNVLCQAFGDRDSPLAWAVLAHEYGHALDDSNAISHGILGEETGDQAPTDAKTGLGRDLERRVISETVADFVAARVLGPASLMPILFLEMLHPRRGRVERRSAGHPPTPLRVELVSSYLKGLGVSTADFEAVFAAYALDYEQKLQDMDPKKKDTVEEIGNHADKVLRPLAETVAARVNALGLPLFDEGNAQAARELQQVLARRQPISGRRPHADQGIYRELGALTAGSTSREDAYKVLVKLDELRVAGSEILAAGWLHRLSSFEKMLLEAFPGGGAEPKLDSYSGYVEKIDDWLSKSLELTAVHAEVLRRIAAASNHAAI
jgi:hypothetical protein